MTRPYSLDLRERVLEAVRNNIPIKEIAKTFNVNCKTIYDWRRLYERTGSLEPQKAEHKGPPPKINEMEKFKEFVDENPSMTQKQMAEKWGGISASSICKAIKKIGHTFKKKHMVMPKEMTKKD